MKIVRYVMLATSLFILLKIKMELAILINFYMYSIALWHGYMYAKNDIINNLLFCTYLSVALIYYVLNIQNVLPYLGVIINFNFILLTVYFIYLKRTITYSSKNRNDIIENKAIFYTNIYAISMYILANIISFILKPNILYIILPIAILVLTIVFMDKVRLYILHKLLQKEK